MPVSYDSSSLLKCTVSMSYIRYVLIQGSDPAPMGITIYLQNPPEILLVPNFNATPQQLAQIK
jgi:hypothetical protein